MMSTYSARLGLSYGPLVVDHNHLVVALDAFEIFKQDTWTMLLGVIPGRLLDSGTGTTPQHYR